MADERTLARRYARALLEVAKAEKKIDDVEGDLHALAEAWESTTDLRTIVAHPAIGLERTRELVGKAFSGKLQETTLKFVDLLVSKKRMKLIRLIAQEFDEASDEAQGIARVRVRSYLPLSDAQRRKLASKVQRLTGRATIVLDEKVDPALLGGIVIRRGDQVVDGSVAGRLRKLKERLILREDERAQKAAANAAEALGM